MNPTEPEEYHHARCRDGKRVEADFFEVPLLESDCVLLCSDGLTNMVDDAEISRF